MFDIGAGEFVALAIVALIVLGPEKLPRYAAEAARMLRQVRDMANDARGRVRRELGPEFDDLDLNRDARPARDGAQAPAGPGRRWTTWTPSAKPAARSGRGRTAVERRAGRHAAVRRGRHLA